MYLKKFEKGGEYEDTPMYEEERIGYLELNANHLDEFYIAKYIDKNSKRYKKADPFSTIRRLRKIYPERIYYMQELEFNLHANWNDDSLYSNAAENESFENDEILLARFLPMKKRTMTLWEDFSRKPTRSIYEKFICVLKGREKFRMISPIYRPNILVNNIEQI